jgi:hypothetical protein
LVDTFQLGTDSKIRTLQSKLLAGETQFCDRRGKHTENRPNRNPEELNRAIFQFINHFPKYESHYCRSDAPAEKLYFDPHLTKAELFRLFIQQQRDEPQDLENPQRESTYNYFDRILVTQFPHLNFKQPLKDTCDVCDETNARLKLARESQSHREVILISCCKPFNQNYLFPTCFCIHPYVDNVVLTFHEVVGFGNS